MALVAAIVVSVSSCRGSTSQRYDFEPAEGRTGTGLHVGIATGGRASSLDTVAVLIDRSASPYWIGVYVHGKGTRAIGAAALKLTGLATQRSKSLTFSPPLPVSGKMPPGVPDTATMVFEWSGVELPFEDHGVLLILKHDRTGGIQQDTLHLRLKKCFRQRHISFSEWVRGL